jgi:hypothetical protein
MLKGFEDDELEMLDRIIKQIRITIKQKGLCIKPFFQDYDRTRTGFVTNTIVINLFLQFSKSILVSQSSLP